MDVAFSAAARRFGILSATIVSGLIAVYAVTLTVGLLTLQSAQESQRGFTSASEANRARRARPACRSAA
jgi:CHASE3 domain sensor protein